MTRNAKKGLLHTGPSQEDSAAGGKSAPTVAQAKPETEPDAILRDYWAAAKARYKRGDYVDYGSDDWCALPLEDPRKMAGLVAFAEMWRKYNPEIADDLNRQLTHPEPLWQRATPEAFTTVARQMAAQQQRREAA
ncbi:hypothetical protein ACWEQO_02050 [Streptomyces sp. NPDC004051]